MASIRPAGCRHPVPITCHVVKGLPWTARHIRDRNLRACCRLLGKTFQKTTYTDADKLREPCLRILAPLELRTEVLSDERSFPKEVIPQVLRMARYHRHWIRAPEDWAPDLQEAPAVQMRALIAHLFDRYPPPAFWYSAWNQPGPLPLAERDWYCHVVQGGNIRKAPGMNVRLSKAAAHEMMGAPDYLRVRQALRYGQLRALGVDQHLGEILRSPIATDFCNDALWMPFFSMISGRADLDRDHLHLVIDYLRMEIKEHHPKLPTLKGRKLGDLVRAASRCAYGLVKLARRYGYDFDERDMLKPGMRRKVMALLELTWEPMKGIRPFEHQRGEDRWRIEELCSQQDLYQEGQELHHCVSSYGLDCRDGTSAIFSLRLWRTEFEAWDPYVTFEVSRSLRRVTEIRAVCNKEPCKVELRIIRQWAEANGVECRF
jgi:hypothetical protein